MAFTMQGSMTLNADRQTVWEALNDPEVLRAAIPGCQSLEKKDNGFAAVVKVKIGPVGATFKGAVELTDLDPPNGYRISGSGDAGVTGMARGGAKVDLADAPEGGTLLTYNVDATIGGKLAQLGGRLIDGVAKKLADQFFTNFGKLLDARKAEAA